jgi:hypothetical protein
MALFLVGCIGSAEAQSQPKPSAGELVKAVIRKELKLPPASDVRWKYVSYKNVEGKQETREVVQTKSGSLDRLVAAGGKPLTDTQQRQEADRILRLSRNVDEQHKAEKARQKDMEQCNVFLQMIPDAFLFDYAGESGNLTKITFKPNPSFQPPSREGKVLHEMMGEMWVDARQQRLVSIWGKLIDDVKFAGGLLGHLEKGGQFTVKRAEMSPGNWELTDLSVNMQGKALLFKTISVQQRELHRNFERVPDDLNLSDAAGILLHQSLIAQR